MNKKLGNSVGYIISSAGTVWTFIELIINPINVLSLSNAFTDFDAMMQVLRIVVGTLSIIFAICFVLRIRKEHTALFDLEYAMAQNNKLHPLRAMVMILHDHESGKNNKLQIDTANFVYKLSKNSEYQDEYDVDYSLSLLLLKKWYQRIFPFNRTFKIYVIAEQDGPIENIEMSIAGSCDYIPTVLSCTTNGDSGDRIERFSGLFQIQIVLPNKEIRSPIIPLEIKYTIKRQFKKTDEQYSFVIIPQNYSRKIKKIKAQLYSEDTLYNMYCYGIKTHDNINPVEQFMKPKTTDNPYEIEFSPNMGTVYFVQFKLKNEYR